MPGRHARIRTRIRSAWARQSRPPPLRRHKTSARLLVCFRGARGRPKLLDEEHKRNAQDDNPSECGEAIVKGQESSLTLQETESLCLRVNHGIGVGKPVRGEISGESAEQLAVVLIEWRGVRD